MLVLRASSSFSFSSFQLAVQLVLQKLLASPISELVLELALELVLEPALEGEVQVARVGAVIKALLAQELVVIELGAIELGL